MTETTPTLEAPSKQRMIPKDAIQTKTIEWQPKSITVWSDEIDVSEFYYESGTLSNHKIIYLKSDTWEWKQVAKNLKAWHIYKWPNNIQRSLWILAMEIYPENGTEDVSSVIIWDQLYPLTKYFGTSDKIDLRKCFVQRLNNGHTIISSKEKNWNVQYVVCDTTWEKINEWTLNKVNYCISDQKWNIFGVDTEGKYNLNGTGYTPFNQEWEWKWIKIDGGHIHIADIWKASKKSISLDGVETRPSKISSMSPNGKYMIGRTLNKWNQLISVESWSIDQINLPKDLFLAHHSNAIAIDNTGSVVYICKDRDHNHYIWSKDNTPIKLLLWMDAPQIMSYQDNKLVIKYNKPNETWKKLESTIHLNHTTFESLWEIDMLKKQMEELKNANEALLNKLDETEESNKYLNTSIKKYEVDEKKVALKMQEQNSTINSLKSQNSTLVNDYNRLVQKLTENPIFKQVSGLFNIKTYEPIDTSDIKKK